MKKQEQSNINELVCNAWSKAQNEYLQEYVTTTPKRLRTCKATVYETTNYYILKSYDTMIAFIDKETDTLYDILRLVYGYTPTSAQHIAKFDKDYATDLWGCRNRYTYRQV